MLTRSLALLALLALSCSGEIDPSDTESREDPPCLDGKCDDPDPCGSARAAKSYTGCSYWPTVTVNSGLVKDFSFAVAVANANPVAVEVSVAAGGKVVSKTMVAPHGLATIALPWVAALKEPSSTVAVPGGAYHLTSTRPVSVYQFNALDYQLSGDCKGGEDDHEKGDGKCYSYSNDASLLLPDHALNKEYLVIALPSQAQSDGKVAYTSPGFFAVVATAPGKTRVEITFAGETEAGAGELRAFKKGETASFSLEQGAVLQILSRLISQCASTTTHGEYSFCDAPETDLTGTSVRADQSVQVISGHNCAMVPFDRMACDHLEEQLFPLQSWGKRYLLAHTASSGKNPSRYRIVSGENGNQIRFAPAVHPPITLDRGRHLELETAQPFEVTGSGRLAVAQLMVGQNYAGNAVAGAPGDPAMALAVPVEQYRTSYGFLAPESYEQNYVNVIAPSSATGSLRFDGNPVSKDLFKPIGESGFSSAALKIVGGAHRLEGSAPFGISVYGVGAYTSYMYPGGLDLRVLID